MRRHRAKVRAIHTDPKFQDVVMARFINCLMWDGKKALAQRIFYDALEKIEGSLKRSAQEVFHEALAKIKPSLEIKSRRIGGATYPVPTHVRPERSQALAIRWIVDAARKRSEKEMASRLAGELKDAVSSRGSALKKKEDAHKMADANRAFSHYRW